MMMMILGGAVCPVRNKTDQLLLEKNVAAPERAEHQMIDFETVA